MPFVANTDEQRRQMLDEIGVESLDDLFSDIPPELRCGELNLPEGLPEQEVRRRVASLARTHRYSSVGSPAPARTCSRTSSTSCRSAGRSR